MQNKCHTCKNTQLDYKFTTIDYITEEEFKIFECKTCNLLFPEVYPKNFDNYYPKQYRSYSKIVNKILSMEIIHFPYEVFGSEMWDFVEKAMKTLKAKMEIDETKNSDILKSYFC